MRWRCSNSAVANRRALHFDYYSTIKKTATPLNEAFTRRSARRMPPVLAALPARKENDNRANANVAREFRDNLKNAD
jgi:hypothetical protein